MQFCSKCAASKQVKPHSHFLSQASLPRCHCQGYCQAIFLFPFSVLALHRAKPICDFPPWMPVAMHRSMIRNYNGLEQRNHQGKQRDKHRELDLLINIFKKEPGNILPLGWGCSRHKWRGLARKEADTFLFFCFLLSKKKPQDRPGNPPSSALPVPPP